MTAFALFMVVLIAMAGYSSAAYCACGAAHSNPVLQKNIDFACGNGADCAPILQDGACYNPNTVKDHCDYAVNSYFQRNCQIPWSCDFAGTTSVSQTAPAACATSACNAGSPCSTTPSTSSPPGIGTGYGTGTSTGTGTETGTGTGTWTVHFLPFIAIVGSIIAWVIYNQVTKECNLVITGSEAPAR